MVVLMILRVRRIAAHTDFCVRTYLFIGDQLEADLYVVARYQPKRQPE